MKVNNKWLIISVLIIFLVIIICVICKYAPLQRESQSINDVLVYDKAFAKRMGLDHKKAINLDPGIYAIGLHFKKTYALNYYISDFTEHHHLDNLNQEASWLISQNLAIFPILFKNEQIPLGSTYNCYLNIYFKGDDPRFTNLKFTKLGNWSYDTDVQVVNESITADFIKMQDATIHKALPTFFDYNKLFDFDRNIHNHIEYFSPMIFLTKSNLSYINTNASDNIYLNNYIQLFNFVKNISYLSTTLFDCDYLVEASNSNGAWLWLEKRNGPTYTLLGKNIKLSLQNFYRYKLPAQIVQSPILKKVIEHNENFQ